jgi:vacuolar-type H+-ATPase subunit I/STV1
MKAKIVLFGIFFILFSVFVGVSTGEAQTSKKKKKTTNTVVMPTPVPSDIPQVISRADQFPNENQIIVTETPTTSTENPQENTQTVNVNIDDLSARIKALESSQKNEYDEKQKRLLLNLDILTRAEQRADGLRKQLFDLIEKQNSIQVRIDQISYDLQPAMIERYAAFAGSLRPEQVREARQKSLESERRNLESLSSQIQTSRVSLETNVLKADALVEKLRTKLEKDIDDALEEKEDQ